MNYSIKKTILLFVLSSCFLCHAPSGRSKSREPQLSDPKILKSIVIQSLDSPSEPIPSLQPPQSLPQKNNTILPNEPTDQEEEMTEPQTLFDAFYDKIEQSTSLTEGLIDYFFKLTQEILHNDDKQSPQKNSQKVRALFDGLRYPLYRHLRDVISACSDRNSFFNGLVEATIIKSSESPGTKEAFIKNLQEIAKTLKEFKLYHIDKPLNLDIENHIKKIEPLFDMLKKFKSSDESQKFLEKIADYESTIVTQNYIHVLQFIQAYLQVPLITTNLPAREGLGKYGLRTGYKGAKALGKFAIGKVISAATTVGMKKLSNYLKGIKKPTLFDTIKQQIQNPKGSPFLNISAPKTLIPEPSLAQRTSELITSPSGMVTAGAGALALGSGLLSTGVLGERVASVSETIAQGTGIIALGSGAIASGVAGKIASGIKSIAMSKISPFQNARKRTILNNIKYGFNSLVWPLTVDQYILPWIDQGVIMRTMFYLSQIPKTSLDQEKFYELLDGLNTANFNLMTNSTNFVCVYMQELTQKINSSPALPMDEIATALQSMQIELFRHRRFIISELSKDKAFTGNYLAYLHAQYLADQNSYFNEQEIIDANKTAGHSAKKIKQEALLGQKFFTITSQEGTNIIAQLQLRNSDDALNRKDLIQLRGPLLNTTLKELILAFEETRREVVAELKSFGVQSRYQLIQHYWNSVIDQEYSKKIKSHLTDLEKDVRHLMFDARESLQIGEIDNGEFIPYQYADAQPIEIPSPLISPYAAELLNDILIQQYIEPLDDIARATGQYIEHVGDKDETREKNPLYDRLPADKNWYLKYPLLVTKAATRSSLYVAKTVADEGVIPVAIAYFTGGTSAALLKIKKLGTLSGIASAVLGIDIKSIGSAAFSGISQISSIGGGKAKSLGAVLSLERFVSNIQRFYDQKIRRPFVHITRR